MKNWIALILMSVVFQGWSQHVEVLIFRERLYDFGTVEEANGNVNHEFVFTNNSGRQVKIISVEASCGCTIPGWSKSPVAQGTSGFIQVSFDPKGRPGYFNKTLTVLTDNDLSTPMVLQIKGEVVTAIAETKSELQAADGNLSFKTKSFSFGTIYINRPTAEKRFTVLNSGLSEIKFIFVAAPNYLKVETPKSLAPNQSGVIKILYDAKQKNQYGFSSDNIQITTDDPGYEVKSISVYASLEDFYVSPTGKEALLVPTLMMREPNIDLGHPKNNTTITRTLSIINTGKRDLLIKALQGNCNCITAEVEKNKIKPGDSTKMKISFTPQNRGGTQQKAIAIYSNDPKNPVQRLMVQVYVEGN